MKMACRDEPVRAGRAYSCSTINRSLPVAILIGPFVGGGDWRTVATVQSG